MCGLVLDFLNWQSIFYITGATSLLFFCVWMWLIYDFPDQNPRVTEAELIYINSHLVGSINTKSSKKDLPLPPYFTMLKSVKVWALFVTMYADCFGFHFYSSELPTYFYDVHNLSVSMVSQIVYFDVNFM